MWNNILKILDTVDKYFKRFKSLVYIILGCLIIFFLITGKIDKSQALKSAKEAAEKISGLKLEKDLLIAQKGNIAKERDSLIEANYFIKIQRDSIQEVADYNAKLARRYKRERNEARDKIRNTLPSESYDFLHNTAYPYIGEDEYPFNALQVTAMHETFVDNEFCNKELALKEDQLYNCKEDLVLAEKESGNYYEAMELAVEETVVSDSIGFINEEIADIAMQEWKKQRRKERWNKAKGWIEKGLYFIGGVVAGKALN